MSESATQQVVRQQQENRETGPYVVRDLSWELSWFLANETPDPPEGSSGNPPQLT
jgi:hypothetical protein